MRRLLVIIHFFILPHLCWASLAVEPFIGAGLFFKNANLYYSAPSVGARLGYSRWGLMIGIDVAFANYSPSTHLEQFRTLKPDSAYGGGVNQLLPSSVQSSNNALFDFSVITIGPSVSFDLPLFFDAYASIIYAMANSDSSKTNISLEGAGVKLGVSYLSLPFVSINLEFQALNYFSCKDVSYNQACVDNSNESSFKGMTYIGLVNLSFPINTGWL